MILDLFRAELKFQLYAVLKVRNPSHDRKSELKTTSSIEPDALADAERQRSMQIAGSNQQTGIEARKSDGTGPDAGIANQSFLAVSNDANQTASSENVRSPVRTNILNYEFN